MDNFFSVHVIYLVSLLSVYYSRTVRESVLNLLFSSLLFEELCLWATIAHCRVRWRLPSMSPASCHRNKRIVGIHYAGAGRFLHPPQIQLMNLEHFQREQQCISHTVNALGHFCHFMSVHQKPSALNDWNDLEQLWNSPECQIHYCNSLLQLPDLYNHLHPPTIPQCQQHCSWSQWKSSAFPIISCVNKSG